MVVSSVASPAAAATFETNKQTKSVSGRKSGSVRPQNFFFLELDLNEGGNFFWPDAIRVVDQQTQNRLPSKNFLGSRRSGKNSDKLERLRSKVLDNLGRSLLLDSSELVLAL